MTLNIPISELKQRTGLVVSRAVENHEDVMIEKYGRNYAVLLSAQRYQELLDAARNRVSERLHEAQEVVYAATADIPSDEIDEIVHGAIETSRRSNYSGCVGLQEKLNHRIHETDGNFESLSAYSVYSVFSVVRKHILPESLRAGNE